MWTEMEILVGYYNGNVGWCRTQIKKQNITEADLRLALYNAKRLSNINVDEMLKAICEDQSK